MVLRTWLRDVAKVLRAETGDLRELARLAGSDPATLYIGTSLDGVDIRGQDLRGMSLPGLNLNKVLRDDRTLVDSNLVGQNDVAGSPPELDESKPPNTSVFIASGGLSRSSFTRRSETKDVRVFDQSQFLDFIEASHIGGVVIVFSLFETDLAERAANALRERGIAFISVIQERGRLRLGTPQALELVDIFAPIVAISPHDQGFGSGVDTSLSEARDFVGLATGIWFDIYDALSLEGINYFMRSKAVGPKYEMDASAQILDRLYSQGLGISSASLIVTWIRSDISILNDSRGFAEKIFKPRKTVSFTRRDGVGRHAYDLAVIGKMEGGLQKSYFEVVQEIVTYTDRDVEIAENIIALGKFRDFEVVPGNRAREPYSWHPDADAIRDFDFKAIHNLVLSEAADVAFIVYRMVEHGELWLTSRDLLGFLPQSSSIWMLIASQLRRAARSVNFRGRHQYLELVVRAALRLGRAEFVDDASWGKALECPDFGADWRLSLSEIRFTGDLFTSRVRLEQRSSRSRQSGDTLDLWIDDTGPRLTRSGDSPLGRVRPKDWFLEQMGGFRLGETREAFAARVAKIRALYAKRDDGSLTAVDVDELAVLLGTGEADRDE
jgi:hypothetical protein